MEGIAACHPNLLLLCVGGPLEIKYDEI